MSVYKFIELAGSSTKSWEDAAQKVVAHAARSMDGLRIAEVVRQDLIIVEGKIIFRVRLNISFESHSDKEETVVSGQDYWSE